MKLKESINSLLNKMNPNQLVSIYEYIKLLQNLRVESPERNKSKSIEEILDMTKSSISNWSNSVIEEREDRI